MSITRYDPFRDLRTLQEEVNRLFTGNAARAFDVVGKRNDALSQYREVLTRPDIYAAHEEARKGLRQPFKTESGSSGI